MNMIKTLMSSALVCLFSLSVFAQEKPSLSDAEVASIAVAANRIDIDYAKVAKEKSKDTEILNFAETMTNDHTAVLEKASALVKKLGVSPKDNPVSRKLIADAEQKMKELREKSGKDFDKAYVDNEVAYHKAVISAVETILIPETENQELRELLQSIVPALKSHLEHAEMLQKGFAGK